MMTRLLLIVVLLSPLAGWCKEVNLTRHLSHHSGVATAGNSFSFPAEPGPATLQLTHSDNQATPAITLNDNPIVLSPAAGNDGRLEVPIRLIKNNQIDIQFNAAIQDRITLRIKQKANVTLNVQSRIHFNTNVSDFDSARAFYGLLGFETLTGFPDANTQAMGRAIGIEVPTSYDGSEGGEPGGYLLHGELIGIGGFRGGVIDLIEFKIPRDDAPPYERLNHLGMISADMLTRDIDADYAYMRSVGVQFIAAPVMRADGKRFAVFMDQDGTFYKLIEVPGETETTETTHIVSLGAVTINVSDLDRSLAWYQMFGYEVTATLPATESIEVARAMGFDEAIETRGVLITNKSDGSSFELVQWIQPFDAEEPYPVPINHIGIHRMAFATTDIESDTAALEAQGVEFISGITPCCSGADSSSSIVAFYDPDGTIAELADQPWIAQFLLPVILWLRDMFD